MKKTFIAISVISLIFVFAGCGGEQPEDAENQVPVQQIQQEQEANGEVEGEEIDLSEEMILQMEQNTAKDEQVEKDQELFHKMGQEGEITEEDCLELQDPDFRAGCIELVELESGAN